MKDELCNMKKISGTVNTNETPYIEDDEDVQVEASLLSKLAVLGDSASSLFASFALLGLASAISWQLKATASDEMDPYQRLGPVPQISPPFMYSINDDSDVPFVSDEMRRAFEKDGVIAVRGLISNELIDWLDEESSSLVEEQNGRNSDKRKRPGTQFHTVEHGVLFRSFNTTVPENCGVPGVSSFFNVATMSNVPQVVAELFGLSAASIDKKNRVRVLRDIFLSKDNDPYVCGWHVDDLGFWPALPDAPGINAWIALDNMPLEGGGGFALAVGSHSAKWKNEAHYATGASTNFPAEGYQNVTDMFERRTGSGTCNIKTSAPHLHRRMEETKRQYSIKRGDVIFHSRWLFHRTIPFIRSNEFANTIFRRYSVRYNLGSAVIPKGYGIEPSVLWDDSNGGKTADQVCEQDDPWYPQAWPPVSNRETTHLNDDFTKKLSIAEARRLNRKTEMKPYLKQLARKGSVPNDIIKPIYDDSKLTY